MNNTKIKNIHIFGGGTISHISNHFALCAPAYGSTAHQLQNILTNDKRFDNFNVYTELTKMAGGKMETNQDILNKINELKQDHNTKIIFFNCALVDYVADSVVDYKYEERNIVLDNCGKYADRLETSVNNQISVEAITSPKK